MLSATPTAAPTPTDPAEGFATGDVVDAATADQINTSWDAYNDDKAYQMADGSYVLIKGGEPVPAEVTADGNASLVELGATTAAMGGFTSQADDAMIVIAAAADEKAIVAGKVGAVVLSVGGAWTVLNAHNVFSSIVEPGWVPGSRDAAIAVAEAWAAEGAGARTYFIAGS